MKNLFYLVALVFMVSCNPKDDENPDIVEPTVNNGIAAPTNITPTIISQFVHDTSAYTQGLEIYNGKLYEGTGDFEESSLRITDLKTGKVEKLHKMGTDKIFGEGITIFKNKIYQLTWQSNLVYVYDVNNINKPIQTLKWNYEGWGITHNDSTLIISDGTANLYFVNADDFRVLSTIAVVDNLGPVDSINELEWVDGFIYANVYQSDFIVKIDPSSGHVVGKINLPGLKEQYFKDKITNRTDVLNGIAYDKETKKFYITGKRWAKLFEVSLN